MRMKPQATQAAQRIYAALYFAGWCHADIRDCMLDAGMNSFLVNIVREWARDNAFNKLGEVSDGNDERRTK